MTEELSRYHYTFIHNAFGSFIENSLYYFADYLYPRFEYKVIGNYNKNVEYINKLDQYGRETDKPELPAIILNPSGDFNLDDANSSAKQLWRFPNLLPGFANRLYEPIYLDNNISVNVAFTRLKGEFELLMLLNSYYEYFDVKLLLIQIFGGENRYIYPRFFNSFRTLAYPNLCPFLEIHKNLLQSSAGTESNHSLSKSIHFTTLLRLWPVFPFNIT